jgi:O-antigen/teichoic acid export membrane protein
MIPVEIRSWDGATKTISGIWTASSLRGRFARGAVWSIVGAVFAQGGNLAASVITARFLGSEQFGKFGMVQSTVVMLGVFAGLGLGVTATKYVAEFRNREPERAGRIISLCCAVAIVSGGLLSLALLMSAPLLAAKTLNSLELATELRIASITLFFNALNGAQMGALSGFEAFRSIARINLLRGVITLPVTAVAVLYYGLSGAAWALTINAMITCVLSHAAIKQQCEKFNIRNRALSAWPETQVLWKFSAPAFLASALVGPATWVANTILVRQPGGYVEMGILSAATQWRYAIGFIPSVLAQFMLPLLSELSGNNDTRNYLKALRWNLILTAVAAAAAAAPVALAAPMIMRLYGRGFQQGALLLVLSALTAVITCLNAVVGTAILSTGKAWTGLTFNALWAAVLLVSCYHVVPQHLALGLAASMLSAYIAHTGWQAVYLRHRLRRPRAV